MAAGLVATCPYNYGGGLEGGACWMPIPRFDGYFNVNLDIDHEADGQMRCMNVPSQMLYCIPGVWIWDFESRCGVSNGVTELEILLDFGGFALGWTLIFGWVGLGWG